MRFSKRLLIVFVALASTGIGLVSPSQAVDSPVAAIVVPCNSATASTSITTAPSGIYRAVVVGACNWAGQRAWGISPPLPCTSPAPCVTVGVTNIAGDTCGTTTGLVRVEACGAPLVLASDCAFQVTVDGQCLTIRGTAGLFTHAGGVFTARFEDSGHFDNTGAFVVLIQPA